MVAGKRQQQEQGGFPKRSRVSARGASPAWKHAGAAVESPSRLRTADLTLVAAASGSVSSLPSHTSDTEDDSPICASSGGSSGGGVELQCFRCLDKVDFTNSTAYASRDPFKRSCRGCNATYKAKCTLIARQKKATGTSRFQKWCNKLSSAEQHAWWKKNNRSADEAHAVREFEEDIEVEDSTTTSLRKARRRINCLLTWTKYLKEEKLLGKSLLDAQASWRGHLADPSVYREMVPKRDGGEEVALEFFDRIELYAEEATEDAWKHGKRRKLGNETEFEEEIAAQLAAFDNARYVFQGSAVDIEAATIEPNQMDAQCQDITLPAHELPEPAQASDFIRGPAVSHPATDLRLKSLQKAAKVEDQLEQEMDELNAQEANKKKVVKAEKEKKASASQKQVLQAKTFASSAEDTSQKKIDSLNTDMDVAVSSLEGESSGLTNAATHITELKKHKQDVNDFWTTISAELSVLASEFDTPQVQQVRLQELKTLLKGVHSKVCAEDSPYKLGRAKVESVNKLLAAYQRRMHTALTKPNVILMESDNWIQQTPLAQAILGINCTKPAVEVDDALNLELCQVYKVKDLEKLQEKLKVSHYFKTQRTFLQNFLKKQPSVSIQETPVTVKVLLKDVDTSLKQINDQVGFTEPSAVKDASLKKLFGLQCCMMRTHVHVGITALCCGTMMVGLEGASRFFSASG
jgi:hypothetical protein